MDDTSTVPLKELLQLLPKIKSKNKKVNIGGAFDDIVSCCGGKTLLQLPPGGIWIWDTSIHTPIMMMIMRRRIWIWIWDLESGIWDLGCRI